MTGVQSGAGAALRLGTRRSPMATAQSRLIAEKLTARTGRPVELVGITTEGDVNSAPLAQFGGVGVFVGAVRDRLLAGEIDLAVHSLKDLPVAPADGLVIAAIPARDDPRDALCAPVKFGDLPPGARVGTGSPRRIAQLRAQRGDLEYVPIRGNAGTRLRKVADGEVDAVVLAAAGLARIDQEAAISQRFDVESILPAPGQGALAVECRADRPDLRELLAVLDDAGTRSAVTAERAVLATLEAGCSAPVGAYAGVTAEGHLSLTATACSIDGNEAVRKSTEGSSEQPLALGRALAEAILAGGGARLMGEPAH